MNSESQPAASNSITQPAVRSGERGGPSGVARPPLDWASPEPAARTGPWRPLRIAMIGQRGVPATFGGVERHVEEIGARLAARGHEVTVYCRANYVPGDADHARTGDADGNGSCAPASEVDGDGTGDGTRPHADIESYRRMRVHRLSTIGTKHLDAIAHSALCTVSAMHRQPDIVHYHALGPGLVAPLPRFLSRARVVLTVHGLDHERAKWGRAARVVLGTAHWMSARIPDATVAVSRALARHYAERFDRVTTYTPNGVESPAHRQAKLITARHGLAPGSYVLFVGRLVPEKAPDLLIRAFRRVRTDHRLVIAGGTSYTDGYVADLHRLGQEDPRVVLAGYAYGELLAELYSNAAAFVLPSYVEGLPLTLLEAIGYGLPVVASDIDPHREVCGEGGHGHRLFPAGDESALADILDRMLHRERGTSADARRLRARVLDEYSWEAAARRLEELYLSLAPE